MELKEVRFDDVLKALRATITNKGGWTGPEIEEPSSSLSPKENLSKSGLAYHKERGRNLMDVVILVAFHCGYFNGTFKYKPFYEQVVRDLQMESVFKRVEKERIDALKKALEAIRDGEGGDPTAIAEAALKPFEPSPETAAHISAIWKEAMEKNKE